MTLALCNIKALAAPPLRFASSRAHHPTPVAHASSLVSTALQAAATLAKSNGWIVAVHRTSRARSNERVGFVFIRPSLGKHRIFAASCASCPKNAPKRSMLSYVAISSFSPCRKPARSRSRPAKLATIFLRPGKLFKVSTAVLGPPA